MKNQSTRSMMKILALILCILCPFVQSCTTVIGVRGDIPRQSISQAQTDCDSIEIVLNDGQRRCFARGSLVRTDSTVSGLCMHYDSSGSRMSSTAEYDRVPVSNIKQVHCVKLETVPAPGNTLALALLTCIVGLLVAGAAVGSLDFGGSWGPSGHMSIH